MESEGQVKTLQSLTEHLKEAGVKSRTKYKSKLVKLVAIADLALGKDFIPEIAKHYSRAM